MFSWLRLGRRRWKSHNKKKGSLQTASLPGAAMPVYLRGLGCLPRWYYHPLCLLHSRWMRIRFQQVWRWCLFLTRQIYKASTLKKSVGEADIQRPCQICFSPEAGRQKNSQAYLPNTKNMCLPSKFKQVNSAHYPRSWSLILSSFFFFKYLHSHSKSKELSLYLGLTNISFSARQLYIMNLHIHFLI